MRTHTHTHSQPAPGKAGAPPPAAAKAEEKAAPPAAAPMEVVPAKRPRSASAKPPSLVAKAPAVSPPGRAGRAATGKAAVAPPKKGRSAAPAIKKKKPAARAVVSSDDDTEAGPAASASSSDVEASESDFSAGDEVRIWSVEEGRAGWRARENLGRPFENTRPHLAPVLLSPPPSLSLPIQHPQSDATSSDDGSDSDELSSEDEEEEEEDSDDEPSSDEEACPPRKKKAAAAKVGGGAAAKPPAARKPAATPAARAMALAGGGGGGAYSPAPGATPTPAAPPAGDGPDRFAARVAERFPFLAPSAVRDADGRRPGEPGYNPRTLRIPPGWFKAAKVTEAQRQWWEVKAKHFDSTLLFKMGKFYEMFEMDAVTGADVCGLAYMKGDQPHCGFPEAAYLGHAEKLARAGRRVVVVEQVETPTQLAARNETRRRAGLPKEAVVKRDVVSVLTAGTLTDPEMLATQPDAAWVVSLVEGPPPPADGSAAAAAADGATLGAAAVDAATGAVLVGAWVDGDVRAGLRALLAELRPAELVLPKAPLEAGSGAAPSASPSLVLSPATDRALRASLPAWPRVNELGVGGDFWDAARTAAELSKARYFSGAGGGDGGAADGTPPVLAGLLASAPTCPLAAAALAALGGAVSYLRACLLDRTVLCLGRVEALPPVVGTGCAGASAAPPSSTTPYPPSMAVDGAALDSLEVLANSAGGGAGSLLASVDHCVTPAGRRRLRSWLCRPLGRPSDIARRQDAVEALLGTGPGAAAADAARRALAASTAACGDLERALARLAAAASPVGGGTGRDAAGVVLYEDAAKRRVVALAFALRGLRCVLDALAAARGLTGEAGQGGGVLANLTSSPALVAAWDALASLEAAADWPAAAVAGRVAPAAGVDAALDAADGALAAADAALAAHLKAERAALKAPGAALVSLHKDPHVLELADAVPVPPSYRLIGQRKGFRRYMSPALAALADARADAAAGREEALGGVLAGLLSRFAASHAAWAAAVGAASDLDALLSLAAAAELGGAGGPMCRPQVLEAALPPDSPAAPPAQFLRATALRHPAAEALVAGGAVPGSSGGATASFVSNDVALGGDSASPPFLLLTGPNMGGKSTLLRQVCLAVLLAHAGGWVPATSFACTAVDAIFTRMGARDAILSGQSTFLVELAETAAALGRATPRSLVALDELGRGTATADGAAIAGAVLDHLAGGVRCRGLFATHYHRLADEAKAAAAEAAKAGGSGDPPTVGVYHMAADVRPDPCGGAAPTVTFLYKLARGACPASHGTHVARLAGMPPTVVDRAAGFAARLAAGETFDGTVGGAGAAAAAAAALARRLATAVASGDAAGVGAARAAAARFA